MGILEELGLPGTKVATRFAFLTGLSLVILAAADHPYFFEADPPFLQVPSPPGSVSPLHHRVHRNKKVAEIIGFVGIVLLILVCGFIVFYFWRKKEKTTS